MTWGKIIGKLIVATFLAGSGFANICELFAGQVKVTCNVVGSIEGHAVICVGEYLPHDGNYVGLQAVWHSGQVIEFSQPNGTSADYWMAADDYAEMTVQIPVHMPDNGGTQSINLTITLNGIDDGNDRQRCDNGACPGCAGMPVWRISEPYLSLWLHDEPLGYQPAIGPRVALKLAYKQREHRAGALPNIFSVGKKWNCSWLSYVTLDSQAHNVVIIPGGGQRTFHGPNDPLTNTRLTGDTVNGFTLSHPDGSKDVYGCVVTNDSGQFQQAFMTERWNPPGQKTLFTYDNYSSATPVVRLQYVIDGSGGTNRIYYVTSNAFSTNLISQVVDAFGRTNTFAYDGGGRLTNVIDVAGISSSFIYDANDWVTSLTTPYGTTSFQITDTSGANIAPNGRSVLVNEPDGSRQLFLCTNDAPGIAASPATNEVPDTLRFQFTNTFDNSELNLRNTFYWGARQYANLSSTNISALTAADFRKARMKHWLKSGTKTVGDTLSLERAPSPDNCGAMEGQKTWYDYAGKTNPAFQGTQSLPLLVARVLPDGTTSFTRSERNGLGAVTTEISTCSAGTGIGLRTNQYCYAANEIDLIAGTNALAVRVFRNVFNTSHQVLTNFNFLDEMTVYTYDSSHRPTSVTAPGGLITTNIYGCDGHLAQQIVIGFATNTYTYANGLVHTHTDERGLTLTNTWDALERLRRIDFPDGTFITNCYDKLDLVRIVDRMGFTNSLGYDSMRRKIAETNALGFYTLYNHCTCGALDSLQDAAGNFTYFFHDNAGRMTNAIYADGYSTTNTYNLIGQLTQVTDSGGANITIWFNHQGLPVAVSNALGRVQSTAYDLLDRATNSMDANGAKIDTTYDDRNRILTHRHPDGGVESWGYALNSVAANCYTNQLNQVTRHVYDAMGRKVAETNANNEVREFTYNGAGDLLTLTDGKGQTTRWNYDEEGRITNKVDAAGREIFRCGYDANGRLIRRWTPAKGETFFIHDAAGNLIHVNHPATPDITLQYDALNRLTNLVDAVGTTRFSYTAASLLSSEDGPWPDDTVSYTYHHRRRRSLTLLHPLTASWTNGYYYDAANRLTNIISPAGGFSCQYSSDLPQLASRLSLPGGSFITNSHDCMARTCSTSLKDSTNGVLNSYGYGYNPGNQRTQQVFAAGNFMDYTYDDMGQLRTANGKESGGATNRLHEQLGYAYDAAGNLNRRTNQAFVQTFNVNLLNELSTVTRSCPFTVAGATISAATNVLVNSSVARLYADNTFASTNHPLADGPNTFTAIAEDGLGRRDTNSLTVNLPLTNVYVYDLNGNLVTNGTRVYDYDDENRLIRVTESNVWMTEFSYDGKMRRRIQKDHVWSGGDWVQTNEVRFCYDGNLPLQHRDSNNLPVLTLTRGLDLSGTLHGAGGIGGLLAMTEDDGTSSYYHSDGNGNVGALVNSGQVVVARYLYDPFGNTLAMSGPKALANIYRYSSKPIHELSGMYDYLHRWYMPELQRWPSRDPLGESITRNLYGFTDNDGINFFDLDGLEKGAEALVRMTRNSPSALGDTPINPLNGLQLLIGLPFSVLSGDIFFNDIQKIPKDACNVLITVNGIFTPRHNAQAMLTNVLLSPRYAGAYGIAAGNQSSYGGDILQIIGDEFGAVQSASFDLARQVNQTYDAFKQNGCCCGSIQVFAHSQGTKTFQRAQSFIKPEAKKLVCYTGIGGETRISPDGLANAENYRNSYDPVPYAQFLNPVNWLTQPFIDTNTRDAGGHNYFSSYRDWVQQLKPNCPCKLISK